MPFNEFDSPSESLPENKLGTPEPYPTIMPAFIGWLKHWTGIDRAIAFTVLARMWAAIATILTVLFVARFLTPNEQGYYYTFSSLVALQLVVELGFSYVVLQLAAHERVRLTFVPDGEIEGDAIALSRLSSVLQTSIRWYSVAGLLMALALLPAGVYFFRLHQTANTALAWRAPWYLLVGATMLAFQIDPVFSFLEGCGFISQVAKRRLVQAVVGSLLSWVALATHHGLYAPALVILGQVVVGVSFLYSFRLRRLLNKLLTYPVREHHVAWRHEIWPFQWKIAVSWIAGYCIFQLFTPVLFAYQGPIAAGKMGMSLYISSGIGSVAIAWMATKSSPFGSMVARGEIKQLDKLFFRTLVQSTALLLVGIFACFLTILGCASDWPQLVARILPPWIFGLLLLTTLVNHVITSEAFYLRAHKREPFLGVSVIGGILVGSATLLLGRYCGANAVAVGYFAITSFAILPYGTYVFLASRRTWHSALPNSEEHPVAAGKEQ